MFGYSENDQIIFEYNLDYLQIEHLLQGKYMYT